VARCCHPISRSWADRHRGACAWWAWRSGRGTELDANPRARSAVLRVAERLTEGRGVLLAILAPDAVLSELVSSTRNHRAAALHRAAIPRGRARRTENEWGQLQMEQSTGATHGRMRNSPASG